MDTFYTEFKNLLTDDKNEGIIIKPIWKPKIYEDNYCNIYLYVFIYKAQNLEIYKIEHFTVCVFPWWIMFS